MTSTHGMEDAENRLNYGWKTVFYAPYKDKDELLGPRVLVHLDDRSLVKAAQVNQGWKELVHKTLDERYEFRSKGKNSLFIAILDAVEAEPDEVTRAGHALNVLIESLDFQKQASASIKQKLLKIQPRLLQPEALILKDEEKRFLHCATRDKPHPALGALVQVIKDLEELKQDPQFKQLKPENHHVFMALKAHYEKYLKNLLDPHADCVTLIQPKVILSGEGLMDCCLGINSHRLHSYRISQEMALSLLSKDRYGLFLKSNASGSHAVKRHGQVHFKGNTTSTGLPVGMESAAYWFTQVLFGQGMAPTALLTLNDVEIRTPPEGTQARSDYGLAQATNVPSGEFFRRYPQHQAAFTEQNPHHAIQASLSVEGVSLEDFMKGVESGEYNYQDLDLNSFSELVFSSLLTNPSDGTPGNFMVRIDQGIPYSIVGIDNDMAFGPSAVLTKAGGDKSKKGVPSLEVKNALYCLPLMEHPLSPETRDKILNTSAELFLLRWLERLKIQQRLYDKLKESGYRKDSKTVPYLKEAVYKEELHLPFQLPCGLMATLLKDFTKLQAKIKNRSAITHNQLFSFFQPLVHRFYAALQTQYPTPLSAYQYIHNSHHEEIYLEDVLEPYRHEVLVSGQTIHQALENVLSQDQTQKQSLDDAAQEIWKDLDLKKQKRITPFLELAARTFPFCFHDPIHLHQSWFQNRLLFQALDEGISLESAKFFLNLGVKVGVRDAETMQNAFHYAVKEKYSHEILYLLLDYLSPKEKERLLITKNSQELTSLNETIRREQVRFLNAKDRKGFTPLDKAMEQENSDSFCHLFSFGAINCNANIALKFYKRKVRPDSALHPTFKHLMDLNPEVEWLISLEELLPPLSSKKGFKETSKESPKKILGILISNTHGARQFPMEIKNQTINEKGEVIVVSNTTNRQVAYAQKKGLLKTHGLYFKFYPALPGLEEAVGRLTRQLLGFGAPYTDLVKLGEGQTATPCLISHEIPGDTLLKVLKTNPQLLDQLDKEDISGMLIAAMLTHPEDGKPDNYILRPHPTKPHKYRIIGIDNDQAFVPAIVKEKPDKTWTGKLISIAQVKTILYCLEQMKNPVHPNIRNIIINTHPDRFLQEWLKELKQVNNQHCGLFSSPEQNSFFKYHKSFIGVPFQQNAMRYLYEKFVQLRDLVTENTVLTHIDLLNKLEPRLAQRYQATLLKDISINDRFKEVDRPFYKVKIDRKNNESHTTVTQSGTILHSMEIPLKEKILESIRLGKENSPEQALKELESIKQEKNEETLKSLAVRVGDINLLKTLTLESSRVSFLKELERQKKTLSPQEQTAILDYLAQQKGIKELPLPNFSAMDDTLLQRISFDHLRKLDLRNCTKITYRSLVHLSQTALALEELNLDSLAQLKEIGDIGTFTDALLVFKELRFLNLHNCINLRKLLVQAPKLYYLNVTNCAFLTDQVLDELIENSKTLQKLVLEGCPLIGERALRKQFPNFCASYLKGVRERGGIIKILESGEKELTLKKNEVNISHRWLMAFERAWKINVNLTNLTSLYLDDNNLGSEVGKTLAGGNLLNLTLLHLNNNNIEAAGAKALAEGNLGNLKELHLWENNIETKGIRGLANGNLYALTALNLRDNNIDAEGAKALAEGNLKNLTSLNLEENNIGYEGAKDLAECNLLNLKELNLLENKIGDSGKKVLQKRYPKARIYF